MQVDWLEKNQNRCVEAKRALIKPGHPDLRIVQQYELLGLARSSYYYEPVGGKRGEPAVDALAG